MTGLTGTATSLTMHTLKKETLTVLQLCIMMLGVLIPMLVLLVVFGLMFPVPSYILSFAENHLTVSYLFIQKYIYFSPRVLYYQHICINFKNYKYKKIKIKYKKLKIQIVLAGFI